MLQLVALSAVFTAAMAVPMFEAKSITSSKVTWKSLSPESKSMYTFEHFAAEFPAAVHASEKVSTP